ncbi:nodulation protein NodN [Burkholderia cepacia]|uniref:MaoC family dehydratase n=1 Tax=Burkholderia cepacia TaxID=292 RepID=UPI0007538E4F|nr:MaoC family dehydratase [Burkholderia cepacia]KVQ18854.1 nodulation protein NodN [Burkholderia cepacia]KVW15611.1 nodulation protein NodN [Burkholderia cepacia]KVZ97247.1 nodulation protein NodN [Burkholderia cepacia]KWH32263.1 nodulation protein NodN [Burkholderia cepacia]
MSVRKLSPDDLKSLVGKELAPSNWISIDQARIDAFADVTGDHQFIHVDPEKAAKSPFGGTVAHGLLVLSLLPTLIEQTVPVPSNVGATVNYGYNKIRFLAPVRSGKQVRAKFVISEFTEPQPGRYQQITTVTVEIEGESRPALIAEWIGLGLVGQNGATEAA